MSKALLVVAALFIAPWFSAGASNGVPARAAFIRWLDDDHWLAAREGQLFKVAALSGAEVRYRDLEAELPAAQGDRLPCLFGGPSPWQVVNQSSMKNELTTASPDGKWNAFNRKNDLYFADKATKKEVRVTYDGSDFVFNGRADWVYHEEILIPIRSQRTFYWSPDSAHIAFLRLDDTAVNKYTLINATQRAQTPEITTYPQAGTPNPTVKIGVVHVAEPPVIWVDLSAYQPKDLLIARLGWHPNGKQVYFYAQNRIQTWLDLCVADCETGKCTKLFRDQTKAWIFDYGSIGPVNFLKDGSFLWFSQRTGYKHLYHYAADGKLRNAVTAGEWDVQSLSKVDETAGLVHFNSNKDTWLGSVPFRVKLDGTELEPLIKEKAKEKEKEKDKDKEKSKDKSKDKSARSFHQGTHAVNFSPGGKYFMDEWSDFETAPQMVLFTGDGAPVRTVATEPAPQVLKQNRVELVKIKTPDGVTLAATVQFPPNMDPKKTYPVWYSGYGGPHMPTIRNAFGGKGGGDTSKTSQGYIVFHADPRSSSTTPHLSWTCYKQLGVQELKDIETALRWLIDTYPTVDAKRIGISGHSYGGYMAAYALTHSKMFAAGIAGAPPTDWRNYDSIYVERYMMTPEENPKGYEASSVIAAAKNTHGKLLIMHGMMDDNVHMNSSIQLADALQKANIDFEMMLYPHARHGFGGAHAQRVQNDFMKRVLQP